MTLIRAASEADIPALVALGEQFCMQHPLVAMVGYDMASLQDTLRSLIQNPDACVLVATHQEQIVGGILGAITPLFFQMQAKAAYEIAWFVGEPFRRGLIATHLFAAFEAWGQAAGVQAFVCSALAESPGVEGFYKRQGYVPYEIQHCKGA